MGDVKFEVIKELGVLSESSKGWTKEVNIISWNDGVPVYDIRTWSPGREKAGKGVTLNDFEMLKLLEIMGEYDVKSAIYGQATEDNR